VVDLFAMIIFKQDTSVKTGTGHYPSVPSIQTLRGSTSMKVSCILSIIRVCVVILILAAGYGCSGDSGSDFLPIPSEGGAEEELAVKILSPAGDVTIS